MVFAGLLTDATGNCRYLCAATSTFIALDTDFYGLTGLDNIIPAQISCRVRIAASHSGVPAIG